jgi:hypothetical protein
MQSMPAIAYNVQERNHVARTLDGQETKAVVFLTTEIYGISKTGQENKDGEN